MPIRLCQCLCPCHYKSRSIENQSKIPLSSSKQKPIMEPQLRQHQSTINVSSSLLILFHFILLSTILITPSLAIRPTSGSTPTTYISHSCSSTTYPNLCYETLSPYATEIKNNPKILATKALSIALSSAKSTSLTIKKLSASSSPGMTRREAGAMEDCVSVVTDSVYELQRSIGEMNGGGSIGIISRKVSDVETWVSAALTDEDTCMDGFDDGKAGDHDGDDRVKRIVRGKILKVAHLISNALALVNHFASSFFEQLG